MQHGTRRRAIGPVYNYGTALPVLSNHSHLRIKAPEGFKVESPPNTFNANAIISQIYICYLLIIRDYKYDPAYLNPPAPGEVKNCCVLRETPADEKRCHNGFRPQRVRIVSSESTEPLAAGGGAIPRNADYARMLHRNRHAGSGP